MAGDALTLLLVGNTLDEEPGSILGVKVATCPGDVREALDTDEKSEGASGCEGQSRERGRVHRPLRGLGVRRKVETGGGRSREGGGGLIKEWTGQGSRGDGEGGLVDGEDKRRPQAAPSLGSAH